MNDEEWNKFLNPPWWHFWDPQSGAVGGVIFGAILGSALGLALGVMLVCALR